jgi:hypothetical protein
VDEKPEEKEPAEVAAEKPVAEKPKEPKKPSNWSKFKSGFTKIVDALTGDED